MIERIEGIVISIIRHNDKHNIAVLYTRKYGRMAFLAPVSKSKSGIMRSAALSLMSVVSLEINYKAGKELYTMRRLQPERMWHNILGDPLKGTVLFFISEFCNKVVGNNIYT